MEDWRRARKGLGRVGTVPRSGLTMPVRPGAGAAQAASSALSTGAMFGVTFGVLILIVLVAVLVFLIRVRMVPSLPSSQLVTACHGLLHLVISWHSLSQLITSCPCRVGLPAPRAPKCQTTSAWTQTTPTIPCKPIRFAFPLPRRQARGSTLRSTR